MRCGGASRDQNAESLPPAERMRAEQAAPGEPAVCWGAGAQRGASSCCEQRFLPGSDKDLVLFYHICKCITLYISIDKYTGIYCGGQK